MSKITVVKLGGAALKASLENTGILENLAKFRENFIVVHGGGPAITFVAKALGVESTFIDGQRVTTPEMMEVVEMVLSGSVNSKIVRALAKAQRPAVGVSGTDAALLECELENPALQKVGKVSKVNSEFLNQLLNMNLIPVVSPVGVFKDQSTCNVNADLAATRIASDLHACKFLFITDTHGVYDAQGKTIPVLTAQELEHMCHSEAVSGGMKVKARAVLEYLALYPQGTAQIINGTDPTAFERFLADKMTGTLIKV